MIEINNLTRERINQGLIKKIASDVLKKEKKDIPLSIAFVGEKEIRKLNRKYRSKDKETDVLSFEDLNEIVLCPKVLKKRAEREKSTFSKELSLSLIHGILHLLGYNDEMKEDGEKMEQKQIYYLSRLK